jgi:hypothetical protein
MVLDVWPTSRSEVFAHLAFGTLLSFAFFGSGARRSDPVLALGHRSAGALS